MTPETIYALILSVFISVLPSLLMLVYTYGKRAGYQLAVDDYNKIFGK